MQVLLYPLEKVVIGDKNICLEMDKSSVFNILGQGESFDEKRYYYFNSEMAIDFDTDDKVEFIEFLGGLDGELQPVIFGVSVFESQASEVSELLEKKNEGLIDNHENGYSYAYLNLEIGIYREATLESVQEDIEEMKKDGVEDFEYIEEKKIKANHWATIGIGKKGYYS